MLFLSLSCSKIFLCLLAQSQCIFIDFRLVMRALAFQRGLSQKSLVRFLNETILELVEALLVIPKRKRAADLVKLSFFCGLKLFLVLMLRLASLSGGSHSSTCKVTCFGETAESSSEGLSRMAIGRVAWGTGIGSAKEVQLFFDIPSLSDERPRPTLASFISRWVKVV